MKKLLLSTAAAACLVSPAFADGGMTGGAWYIDLSAGVSSLQGISPLTTGSDALDTEFNSGWVLSGAIGHRWGNGLRTEIEVAHRTNDADKIVDQPNGGGPLDYPNVSGDVSQFSVLANVLYDHDFNEKWSFSLGAGLGMSSADISGTGDAGATVLLVDAGDDWSFAYQLIAGVNYDISDRAQVYVAYKYHHGGNHDLITYPPPNSPLLDDVNIINHSLSLGIRVSL